MSLIAQLDSDFAFKGTEESPGVATADTADTAGPADPLGPLARLPGPGDQPGVWAGHGFNAIWRPHLASTGRIGSWNSTSPTTRSCSPGSTARSPTAGSRCPTSTCSASPTCSRSTRPVRRPMGCTSSRGSGRTCPTPPTRRSRRRWSGWPRSRMARPSWPRASRRSSTGVRRRFPTTTSCRSSSTPPRPPTARSTASRRRSPSSTCRSRPRFARCPAGVTQGMIENPNSVLQQALQQSLHGTTMKRRTFLHVSTTDTVIRGGGGTANTAFLASSHNPPQGNARAAQVRGDVLDRDDRRHRRPARHRAAAVHAVGDARLQRHPLAARDGGHARQAVSAHARHCRDVDNPRIADRLEAFAMLLELNDANPYTIRAYRRAADGDPRHPGAGRRAGADRPGAGPARGRGRDRGSAA